MGTEKELEDDDKKEIYNLNSASLKHARRRLSEDKVVKRFSVRQQSI